VLVVINNYSNLWKATECPR